MAEPKPVSLLLTAGALGADTAAAILPAGPGRDVARFVAAALRFGSDLVEAGADAAAHLERLHDADPLLADVQARWRARIARKRHP